MFKNIFGNKGSNSKTGFFKVKGTALIEINELPGKGSINDLIESLGLSPNQVRTVHTHNSGKINCLGFLTLSKKAVFVLANSPETRVSYTDLQKEINQINWDYEYSCLNVEDILDMGIEYENFDLSFLKSVIDLREDGDNVYKSESLGLYLHFENDILNAYTSTGWDNSATKWLQNLNPLMVKEMTEEARQYHQNEMDVMEEVNKQAVSILGIPQAVGNEFIPLHTKRNGNINFYTLLLTHYTKKCQMDEFLFMNKGRFRKINENTIEAGNFIYSFNTHGHLENIVRK